MMISFVRPQGRKPWAALILAAVALIALLAGCGGGGGGGGTTPGTTVTLQGTLQDKSSGIKLQNRTVQVQNTNLIGITNSQGQFSIAGVPAGNVTLVVTDSIGTPNGTVAVNVGRLSGGAVRDAGILTLDLGSLPPPPPIQ